MRTRINPRIISMVIFVAVTVATAQQMRVDSVCVDTVWNSDSSWYDGQGILQQRYSRDLYLSFKPMPVGGGMAQCFVALSIDSAKTWAPSPNPLSVLDSGLSSPIQCGTVGRVKLRVLGQDRPGVAFKITAQQWQPIIAGNPKLVIMGLTAPLTPGESCSVNLQCSLNNVSQGYGFAPIVKVWWDAFGAAGTWSDSTATLSYTWQTTVPTGTAGQSREMIAKARDANGLWSAPCTLTVQFGDPLIAPPGDSLVFSEGFENPAADTLWQTQFATWTEGGIYPQMRYTTDTFYTGTRSLTSDSNATALQYWINPLGAPLSKTVVGVQFYILAKAQEGINFTVWIGKNSGSSGGLTPGFGLGFDSTNVLKTTYFNAYTLIPETDKLLSSLPIQPKHWYKCCVQANLSDTTSDSAVTYYIDNVEVNKMPLPMSNGTYVPFPGIDRLLVYRGPGGPNTIEPYYVDDIVLYTRNP